MNDVNDRNVMNAKTITILTTGAGAPGAASIFKALRLGARAEGRGLRIVACDMDRDVYGFHLADRSYIVPAGSEPGFIDSLLEICRAEKPDLLFSWVDTELMPIAGARERIEELGTRVVISTQEAVGTCLDKSKIYELASGLGLAPGFRLVQNQKEFERAVKSLGYPESTVCFKPVHGYGGRGFRILDPKTDRAELLFTEKPNSTVTTLDDVLAVFRGINLPMLMVMEYLPGKEYTVDMLLDHGEAKVTIPRERVRVRLGISNIARLERNEEIIEAAETIARKLGLNYNVNMQFRLNSEGPEGRPKLIEVQPRLAGTTAASIGAGANLPWLAAKLALREHLPDRNTIENNIKWGTTMKRFWKEVYTNGQGDWFI